jgi:23S rRNA pseudouridine2605 synthase
MAVDEIRLQVYLARSGVASRRKSEELITAGRVTVNGDVVTRLGTKVGRSDRVTVDGKQVAPVTTSVYLAVHKPPGMLCSNRDPEGRPLVVDLVRDSVPARVFHVGRLDFMSSGLIFLTNDGSFAAGVMHPSREIEKEYWVETKEPIPDELLESFAHGVVVEGVRYRLRRYARETASRVRVTLVEGKNREIRRVFDAAGLPATRVHRVRIGSVRIGRLRPGEFRQLTADEVAWFQHHGGHT